ncbi:hypothetical protein ACLOJK_016523 [Asimina triloba]
MSGMEEMRNAQGDCPAGLSPATTLPAQESHDIHSESPTSTAPAQESHDMDSQCLTPHGENGEIKDGPGKEEMPTDSAKAAAHDNPGQTVLEKDADSTREMPIDSEKAAVHDNPGQTVSDKDADTTREMPIDSEQAAVHDNPGQTVLEKDADAMKENTDESGLRVEVGSDSSPEALSTQNHQSPDVAAAEAQSITAENTSHPCENGDPASTSPVQAERVDPAPRRSPPPPSLIIPIKTLYTDNILSPGTCDVIGVSPVGVAAVLQQTPEIVCSPKRLKDINAGKSLIDTAAPIESVKEAVSKYGGIVDWKAHKILTVEALDPATAQRRKHVEVELERAQEDLPRLKRRSEAAEESKDKVVKERDNTRKMIDALKRNVEKAQTEANQAKQDCELARLRTEELEKGIANEASIAAKAQLEVARARHATALADLKAVKDEIEALKGDYVSLASDSVIAQEKAEEAASALKENEKTVEDLTLELIGAKGTLESAQAAHLEAEEKRITASAAREQEAIRWQKELNRAEEELHVLNSQVSLTKDLESKLDAATELLLKQKAELENFGKDDNEQKAAMSPAEELKVVKQNIEKAEDEINCLKIAAESLKSELEREKMGLATMRQREGMASITVATLEAELCGLQSQLELVQSKEKEAKQRIAELPTEVQEASQAAEQAITEADAAREELRMAEEDLEQAKAGASTAGSRLNAVLKEIEAAKASEGLAVAAAKALQESEMAAGEETDDSSRVKLPFQQYCALSKQAHEAEEEANGKVADAVAQIAAAKEAESRSMERLEEAKREKAEKEEARRMAMEKAEKANEGKLGVEQELRKRRAEGEQRRKASEVSGVLTHHSGNLTEGTDVEQDGVDYSKPPIGNKKANEEAEMMKHGKSEKKKKKTFFPRFIMFMTRKKSHSTK